MSMVLQRQLDTYARSVREANGGAQVARTVDDLIDVGLRLYESAQEAVRRWHADVASGTAAYDAGDADRFMSLYRTLDRAFDQIAALAGDEAAGGAAPDDARRLTRERMYLKAMLSVDPDKALRAAGQVERGELKSAAEVRRELLRRLPP